MKVSVILTSYNKARYIQQAIASVMTQTLRDWELLIVDDHSTDGAYEIASAMCFDRCWLMKTDLPKHRPEDTVNRYAHNINLAFRQSKGEYITYLCDDDLYLPWRLEGFAYVLDQNPGVHVVYGQQQMLTEEDGVTRLSGVRDTVGVTRQAAQQIDHSSVMHRRECFEKVGGWDEAAPMRLGDAGFWNRLNAAGYDFYPMSIPMDCHRYNNLSVTHKIDHPEREPHYYPPYDDLGNKRLVKNAVEPVFSAVD